MAESSTNDLFALDCLSRQKRLANIRQDYEELWKDVIDFTNLRRYNLDGTQRKGKKVGMAIYDSTATDALRDLSDGLFGYLISPAMQWFQLRVADEQLMKIKEIKAWLEEVSWSMYVALQRSNFYEIMPEYFQDGGSIGTATLYSEEDIDEGRIVCTICHPGEVWVAENKYGMVDTTYRKVVLTARQAISRFGKKADLSQSLLLDIEDQTRQDNEYTFYHIVQPKVDLEMVYHNGKSYPRIAGNNKPFVSYYIQENENKIASKSGYYSLPYQVWRWRKNSNEIYGRSPASDAIVDILTSNQMGKTLLHAAHMAAEPPLNIPAEMKGKVRITPRGMNYYEDQGRVITAVQMGQGGYPVGVDREDRVKDAIKRHFMTDFFTLLSRAAMDGRQLSVPQVMEMQGEKAVMLGTIVGRLNSECFDPFLDRVYQIEFAAGRIPPPPELLVRTGKRVHVEYMGPLAQAQRRLFKTQGIYQGLDSLKPILEFRADVLDNIDFDVVSKQILEATGMPASAIKEPNVVAAERDARAKQMEAQMQTELILKAAAQVPNISKKPEDGSPAKMLMGGEQEQ